MTTKGVNWDLISFSKYGDQLGWSSYPFLKKMINNKNGLEFINKNGYLINESYYQKMIDNLDNNRNYENDNWYVFLPQLN
jgi:aminopeptidase-like protein